MSRDAAPAARPASSSGGPRRFVWRGIVSLAAVALATVWHVSIFWRLREQPLVFAGLLAAVWGLVALGRAVARGMPADRRTPPMRAAARLNGTGLVFVAFLLALVFAFHVGFERAASDGRSYFIQVRSLVMDRDLDFANDETAFGGHGASQYPVGSSRVDLQACKLEYSIVSPK